MAAVGLVTSQTASQDSGSASQNQARTTRSTDLKADVKPIDYGETDVTQPN